MNEKERKSAIRREIGCVAGLRIREAQEGQEGESRVIEGYTLKFGVRSRLICDWWDNYYEVLEPGCVTKEMLDEQDIKLTMFHDRQLILGRSKQGEGTLGYEVDKEGVKFWAEMPKTEDGDKALELVGRGDIDGCSFMYSTDEDETPQNSRKAANSGDPVDSENAVSYEKVKDEETGEEVILRHVKRIDRVYDFTLTPDPAYEQTEVAKREMSEGEKKEVEREKKEKEVRRSLDYAAKAARIKRVRDHVKRGLIF